MRGDGALTVRFAAGGLDEMCQRLVTLSDRVTVENSPGCTGAWRKCARRWPGSAAQRGIPVMTAAA